MTKSKRESFTHVNFIFMHENEISMLEKEDTSIHKMIFSCMENYISMHENKSFAQFIGFSPKNVAMKCEFDE